MRDCQAEGIPNDARADLPPLAATKNQSITCQMIDTNRLVIIGNGFDLAHGLKTSYKNFLDWYFSTAYNKYLESATYKDLLIEIVPTYIPPGGVKLREVLPTEDILARIKSTYGRVEYKSDFFKQLTQKLSTQSWVDIEREYFRNLKLHFKNNVEESRQMNVRKLNWEFNYLIGKLAEYIDGINKQIPAAKSLFPPEHAFNLEAAFKPLGTRQILFLCFNYTETLIEKKYTSEESVIFIHGRVKNHKTSPIIFGYGDETDSAYQDIEDSGDNLFLEHIKSFGYFSNDNYNKLISYIDSYRFSVSIVGHSCGLSDRVLLNEIFEHQNCQQIDIFYHRKDNATDNFKEITQEISRHFKAENKNKMRRRVKWKTPLNIIPQNKS